MPQAEKRVETIGGVPVEAITDPRGLVEYKRLQMETDFLNMFNILALGGNELAVLREEEIRKILGKYWIEATQLSFDIYELLESIIQFLGPLRPSLVGRARADKYIEKAWRDGFKEGYYYRDASDLKRYVKELLEKEGGEREEEGEERGEEEESRRKAQIPYPDYLRIGIYEGIPELLGKNKEYLQDVMKIYEQNPIAATYAALTEIVKNYMVKTRLLYENQQLINDMVKNEEALVNILEKLSNYSSQRKYQRRGG